MFYLKYRPQTIGSLDNSQVRPKITNLLKSKDLPHALLLIGPRGMGKTSTARIVAKAVNCLENAYAGKGDTFEPCNTCFNCKNIDAGSSPDVVEMDAASNRGIEEVRKLIREASFAPMTSKYRVYIIDEAHMITNDAFNALLKTLEEPPETVMFILATTNEEKVPTTIISRCLRIPFGRAHKDDILHMLERIAKSESIDAPAELMDLIATYSENSFRDAAKMFEELVMQEALTLEKAQKYLGVRAKGTLLELMQSATLAESMSWIEEFVNSGGNVKRAIEDMLETLRLQLIAKSTDAKQENELTFSLREISQLIKLFYDAYNQLRATPIESLPLEIAVVEFYNASKK